MKMLNEKSTSLIRVLISLVLSYLALVSGLKDIASLSVPDTWIRDFLILLGLSALTSLGLVAVKKTSMILLLLAIRFITIVLIGIPFGELLSTDFVLLTALILDITFSLPLKPALAVLVLGIPVCLVSQMDFSVYYFKAGTPSEVALYAYGSWA
ncbi:MAG: hypothetical protein DRP49_09085, partial [Spirochaetes bacterium]